MKIIKFNKNFYNQFQTKIEKRNSLSSQSIQEDVKKIIYDVKNQLSESESNNLFRTIMDRFYS